MENKIIYFVELTTKEYKDYMKDHNPDGTLKFMRIPYKDKTGKIKTKKIKPPQEYYREYYKQ